MKRIHLIHAVSFLVLVSAAPGAFAGDEKIYPGTSCNISTQCIGSTTCSEQKRYSIYGRIYNGSSNTDLKVDCPIIKDDYSGKDFNSAGLYFMDTNPTRGVSCTFYSMNSLSTSASYGWFSSRKTTAAFSNPNGTNYFGFSKLSANKYHGYAGIRCTIPRMHHGSPSYLISYRVDE